MIMVSDLEIDGLEYIGVSVLYFYHPYNLDSQEEEGVVIHSVMLMDRTEIVQNICEKSIKELEQLILQKKFITHSKFWNQAS